jgi:triphosphatase
MAIDLLHFRGDSGRCGWAMSASEDELERRSADQREVEWHLAATDLGAVQRWIAEHHTSFDGLVMEPRPSVEVHDTYLDSSDWRIQRAGFALRVRNAAGGSEATLKGLSSAREGVADRREVTEPLTGATLDAIASSTGPVGTRVHAVVGEHPLRVLFAVRTARQRFAVKRRDGDEDIGEITLDATVISRDDGEPQTSVQRVEVEARAGDTQPLEDLVKTLSDECALEVAADSKYVLGLKAIGLTAPPPELGEEGVDAFMTAEQVARATLRRYVSAWLLHESGARLGEDSEELHDLRVAARRIDATIGLFAKHLPATIVRLRKRIKMIRDALGTVRDLDIQLAHLDVFQRSLAPADSATLQPLRQILDSERQRARARMLRMLDAEHTEKSLARLKATLLTPPRSRAPGNPDSITVVAPIAIRSRYKKVRKAAARLSTESSAADYHAVRGRIKKLRYAVEAVAPIYGAPAKQFVRLLRRLQDDLGIHQDAEIASNRLCELAQSARARLSASTTFAMGRMVERHHAAGMRARDEYERNHHKLRKRWRKLRQKFDQLSADASQPRTFVGPDAG